MKYNAQKEKLQNRWTHETLIKMARRPDGATAAKTLRVLDLLNSEPRMIDRTNTKKRFRMPVGFAEVIGIETHDTRKLPTRPPTELAAVHDTLTGLFEYVKEQPLTPAEIVTGIGVAIHQKRVEMAREEQVVAIVAR